ncbi:hypothetical protein NDU88_006599 [Pleurodeles waltl]|uniref:Uncharacterized protein n=1 Tax=Pleurodeles waltl TaxID=8319 RepID=A0AAV7LT12_PLEWA|nr:hypothetical protein NDU88_006599 [Pleurodeles waltl]
MLRGAGPSDRAVASCLQLLATRGGLHGAFFLPDQCLLLLAAAGPPDCAEGECVGTGPLQQGGGAFNCARSDSQWRSHPGGGAQKCASACRTVMEVRPFLGPRNRWPTIKFRDG